MGYWENRQAQQMYQAMNDAEQASQEIADIYAKASRELNYEIQKIYERYRDKFNLSDEEAQRLLNTMRDPTDIDELIQKLKETKGPAAQEILKELESPAYRARLERLQNLQQEIDMMMRDVYGQEKKVSTSHYVDQYCNAYYQEIYNLQKRTGLQFSFSAVDPNELNRLLSMSWAGAKFSDRIWKNTETLKKELKEQLILGYLTGKSEREMAAEIANKFSTGAYKARRLVRTEAAYVDNQGHLAAYKDSGIEKYRIVATLDLRTSEMCRGMDGKEFPVAAAVVGENMPPFHPFCRTVTISVLDDENLAELKRRARDPVTGDIKTFPGDITYPQWYKNNVANNPKAIAAEKMIKNRQSDLRQYEVYKELLGKKEAGKTFAHFQDMKYNEPEKWKDVKGFASYMRKYPDSSRPFYNIMRDLKEIEVEPGVCLPAKKKTAYILPEGKRDPNHIMKRMLERHITDDELRKFVDDAKVMFVQWGGKRQMFINGEGVAVLTRSGDDWIFKTAWKKDDFDEETLKILEVMRKYGK